MRVGDDTLWGSYFFNVILGGYGAWSLQDKATEDSVCCHNMLGYKLLLLGHKLLLLSSTGFGENPVVSKSWWWQPLKKYYLIINLSI